MNGKLFCWLTLALAVFNAVAMPGDWKEADELYYSNLFNTTLNSCPYQATCKVNNVEGVCVSINSGCCSGTVTSNLCPGSSDVRCCTSNHCSTPKGSGTCMQSSKCSSEGGSSVSGYCIGPSDLQCCVKGSNPSGKITRSEIINRAQDWVNRQIPYSQSKTTDGYRQDCSGYTSMAWKSSTSGGGHTTSNMQEICTKISKSELKSGDAILHPSSHVLIFHKWIDSDNFYEYAEHEPGTVASHDSRAYSYFSSNGFFPCRYNYVSD